eukprot:scaffold4777_cov256-Chaetoceros_neogracile.AAC.2
MEVRKLPVDHEQPQYKQTKDTLETRRSFLRAIGFYGKVCSDSIPVRISFVTTTNKRYDMLEDTTAMEEGIGDSSLFFVDC